MEDDDLETMKHFFNFLYQDGCQLKELDLYNSDKQYDMRSKDSKAHNKVW